MSVNKKNVTPGLPFTAARLAAGKPVHIVLYGDSISEVGRTPNYFGGATCRDKNWGERLGALLGRRYRHARFRVSHFAIGGQNAYEGLGRLDWLTALKPDLVLIEFGANDCGWHFIPPAATGLAVGSLVEGIRARTSADVVIVIPGGDNPQSPTMRHLDQTLRALRRTAAVRQSPVVDVRAAILRATQNGRHWTAYHNGLQDCHPNDRGHAVWAQAACAAICACPATRA